MRQYVQGGLPWPHLALTLVVLDGIGQVESPQCRIRMENCIFLFRSLVQTKHSSPSHLNNWKHHCPAPSGEGTRSLLLTSCILDGSWPICRHVPDLQGIQRSTVLSISIQGHSIPRARNASVKACSASELAGCLSVDLACPGQPGIYIYQCLSFSSDAALSSVFPPRLLPHQLRVTNMAMIVPCPFFDPRAILFLSSSDAGRKECSVQSTRGVDWGYKPAQSRLQYARDLVSLSHGLQLAQPMGPAARVQCRHSPSGRMWDARGEAHIIGMNIVCDHSDCPSRVSKSLGGTAQMGCVGQMTTFESRPSPAPTPPNVQARRSGQVLPGSLCDDPPHVVQGASSLTTLSNPNWEMDARARVRLPCGAQIPTSPPTVTSRIRWLELAGWGVRAWTQTPRGEPETRADGVNGCSDSNSRDP